MSDKFQSIATAIEGVRTEFDLLNSIRHCASNYVEARMAVEPNPLTISVKFASLMSALGHYKRICEKPAD